MFVFALITLVRGPHCHGDTPLPNLKIRAIVSFAPPPTLTRTQTYLHFYPPVYGICMFNLIPHINKYMATPFLAHSPNFLEHGDARALDRLQCYIFGLCKSIYLVNLLNILFKHDYTYSFAKRNFETVMSCLQDYFFKGF